MTRKASDMNITFGVRETVRSMELLLHLSN